MPSDKPDVRYATRQDVPAILRLIRELADYENAADKVEATEEMLLRTIAFAPASTASGAAATEPTEPTEPTSPSRPARCLLLFADGEPAGAALYFYSYSTYRARPGIYLEDLFVRAAHRNKGYGRALLAALAAEVRAMDGGRLEWSVLKWNTPSIRFYEHLGAVMQDGKSVMRVDGDALASLAGGAQ